MSVTVSVESVKYAKERLLRECPDCKAEHNSQQYDAAVNVIDSYVDHPLADGAVIMFEELDSKLSGMSFVVSSEPTRVLDAITLHFPNGQSVVFDFVTKSTVEFP